MTVSRPATPAPDVRWWSATVDAGGREVSARVFRPEGPQVGWLVWAHGGSWTRGSVDGWHQPCADLAARSGCTLASVEYRLAPRHRHPAALHDVLAIVDWARRQADADGVRLAVGGDSAGGTLAACAALACRDAGAPLAAQVLVYPPLDPWCRSASYTRYPGRFPAKAELIAAWQQFRTGGTPAPRDYSTPFEADDLTGSAPAVLAVGEYDPVIDDVREYASRLTAAGVDVELRVFAGMGHGVFLVPGEFDATGSFLPNPLHDWLGSTLRRMLSGQACGECPQSR